MLRSPLVSLSVSLILVPAAHAQDAPKPAAELQRYAAMIGNWEGTGTVAHDAGGSGAKWTCKSSAEWALGGHVVRERSRIDIEGWDDVMLFDNLWGYDTENRRHVLIETSNMGVTRMLQVHWTQDGAMVSGAVRTFQGQAIVERWQHHIQGDTWQFSSQEAQGAGSFHTHVSGEMKRVSKEAKTLEQPDASFMAQMFEGRGEHLERLKPMAGEYRLKGWFKMSPQMPQVEFTASEEARMVFGGTLLFMKSKGDPIEGIGVYEAVSWMCWDGERDCYTMCFANNMGEIGSQDCRFIDDRRMISTHEGVYMGTPTVTRGIIELGENGAFESFSGTMVPGAEEPFESFHGSYEKQ